MTQNSPQNPRQNLRQELSDLPGEVKPAGPIPQVRRSHRRCFVPHCQGWIQGEFHGGFEFGKVRYQQYMNCRCNGCGAEAQELVRSFVEGQPEMNGSRFLLHDPEFDRFYEVPGFGQSMLPFIQQAYRTGESIETLLKPMFDIWLAHYRRLHLMDQLDQMDQPEQPC